MSPLGDFSQGLIHASAMRLQDARAAPWRSEGCDRRPRAHHRVGGSAPRGLKGSASAVMECPLLGSSSEPLSILLAACATLMVSALASATSAALAALGEHRAEAIFEDDKERPHAGLRRLVERPDAVRFSLLALDGLAKLGFGVALAVLVTTAGLRQWAAGLSLVAGAFLLLLTLTVVRALAVRDPVSSLGWAAPVGGAVEALLRPLAAPLVWLSRLLRGKAATSADGTTEQLEYLIEKGSEAGYLDDDKRDLLESVIEFSTVRVREIMVPRPKVVALPIDAPYQEVVRSVVESGHSRLPVYEDSVDNVVGVLYARRLLEALGKGTGPQPGRFRLEPLLANPFFVPETMRISHLLAEFQHRSLQIAVVVDEFGGTAGVVTLEDVVEEIVGEIRDEGDAEEDPIRVIAEGVFLADGGVSIRDAEEFLEEFLPDDREFEFPEDGDYDTVGGFATAMAGRVPQEGEELRYAGLLFTIRAADEKRVLRIELSVEEEPSPGPSVTPSSAEEALEVVLPLIAEEGAVPAPSAASDPPEAAATRSANGARR